MPPALSANAALTGMEVFVDLADLIDVGAEIERKEKEILRLLTANRRQAEETGERELRRARPRRRRARRTRRAEGSGRPTRRRERGDRAFAERRVGQCTSRSHALRGYENAGRGHGTLTASSSRSQFAITVSQPGVRRRILSAMVDFSETVALVSFRANTLSFLWRCRRRLSSCFRSLSDTF